MKNIYFSKSFPAFSGQVFYRLLLITFLTLTLLQYRAVFPDPVKAQVTLTSSMVYASSPQLWLAQDYAVGRDGTVFIANCLNALNNRINIIDGKTGTFKFDFGSAGSADGQLNTCRGIAVDNRGYIYVADSGNNRVQVFTTSGTYVRKFGSSGTGNGQFASPGGIALDSAGNIYIADTNNHRIQKFDNNGNFLSAFGSSGSTTGKFNTPDDIFIDKDNNIYVADTNNNRIQKFDSSGTFLLAFGSNGTGNGQFSTPHKVAVDGIGNIYVADTGNNRIQIFNSSGTYLSQFGSYGSANNQFDKPILTVDSSGNIYAGNNGSQNKYTIRKFSYGGTGYQISNLTSGLDIIDQYTGSSIKSSGTFGVNDQTASLRMINTNGIILSDLSVNMTTDRDWSSISVLTDAVAGKSVAASLVGVSGVASTHTLFVPVPYGRTSNKVRICPDARSLAEVTTSCANGVEVSNGSYSESFGSIFVSQFLNPLDYRQYWTVSGMPDGGGVSTDFTEYSGTGAGTAADPYQITTCSELQEMKYNRASYYSLTNDIDCSDTINWNSGSGFSAIGNADLPFSGVIEGNNHNINGIYINQSTYASEDCEDVAIGLIGYAYDATFRNFNINVAIKGIYYVGGLVGYMKDTSIDNCSTSGTLDQGVPYEWGGYFGGIAGGVYGDSHINHSSSSVNITYGDDPYYMGGLVGTFEDNGLIENSFATGSIHVGMDPYEIGGLIGEVAEVDGSNLVIDNCYATGEIHTSVGVGVGEAADGGDGYWIGGLLGWVGENDTTTTTITKSYATGDLVAEGNDNYWYGGLVGWTLGTVTISDSYATGSITALGDDNYWMGGFGGQIGGRVTNITNCYATGDVTAGYAGNGMAGFAGWVQAGDHSALSNIHIDNSYATGDITVADEAYGVGGFVAWMGSGHASATNDESLNISYSYSSGNIKVGVEGKEDEWGGSIGGFIGFTINTSLSKSLINDSFSLGSVDSIGDVEEVGGFIGSVEGQISIERCASLGDHVNGSYDIGGFVGDSYYRSGSTGYLKEYNNSYTRTNVENRHIDLEYPNDTYTGGFVGYSDSENSGADSVFVNDYSTGIVSNLINTNADINTTLTADMLDDDTDTAMHVADASDIVPGTYLLIGNPPAVPFQTTVTAPVNAGDVDIYVVDPSGFGTSYPDNYIIFDKGVPGKEETHQITAISGNKLTLYSYDTPQYSHDSGSSVTARTELTQEIVYVRAVSGNDLTVTREMGYTYADAHTTGDLVTAYVPPASPFNTGGFAGFNTGNVTDCYWDTETSGYATTAAGTGMTTAQMKDVSNFPTWDFDTVWGKHSLINDGYPFLPIDDATFSALEVSAGSLSPGFSRYNLAYTVLGGKSLSQISFKPTANRSIIRGITLNGNVITNDSYSPDQLISTGDENYNFYVTSFDGRVLPYTVDLGGGTGPTPTATPTVVPTTPETTTVPTSTAKITPTPVCIFKDAGKCIVELKISNVTASSEGSNEKICWETNIPSTGQVRYGLSEPLSETTKVEETAVKDHCQVITALKSGQVYLYDIVAFYEDHTASFQDNFLTAADAIPGSCKVTLNDDYKLDKTTGSMTITFTTDNTANCRVNYGANTNALTYTGKLSVSGSNYSALMDLTRTNSSNLFYRVSCTNGDIQCSAANSLSGLSILPETGTDDQGKNQGTLVNFLEPKLEPTPVNFAALTGLVLTVGTLSLAFPKIWIVGLVWLFPKKKQKPWGIVYNAATRKPIPFAVLRIYSQDGKFIKENVSDLQGRYNFLLDPGSYVLRVEQQDFQPWAQDVTILNSDSQYTGDVALQQNGELSLGYKLKRDFPKVMKVIWWVLGIAGLIFSCFALYVTFNIVNVIIVLSYIIQFLILLALRDPRNWGLVFELDSEERLGGAFVRVLDVKQGRQIDVQMTDEKGRFGFRIDPGDYILLVSKPGYKVGKSNLGDITLADGSTGYIYTTRKKDVNFAMQKI